MWPAGLPHLAFSRKTKPYKMCVLLDTVCLLFPVVFFLLRSGGVLPSVRKDLAPAERACVYRRGAVQSPSFGHQVGTLCALFWENPCPWLPLAEHSPGPEPMLPRKAAGTCSAKSEGCRGKPCARLDRRDSAASPRWDPKSGVRSQRVQMGSSPGATRHAGFWQAAPVSGKAPVPRAGAVRRSFASTGFLCFAVWVPALVLGSSPLQTQLQSLAPASRPSWKRAAGWEMPCP